MPKSFGYTYPKADFRKLSSGWNIVQRLFRYSIVIVALGVLSCSDTGIEPTPPLDEFMKNYIEAIFLGTGSLIPQDGFTACVARRGQVVLEPSSVSFLIN